MQCAVRRSALRDQILTRSRLVPVFTALACLGLELAASRGAIADDVHPAPAADQQSAPATDATKDPKKKQDDKSPKPTGYVEDVTVVGRADELVGTADSATQGTIGSVDLEQRPILRPGEILEAVPGVIITQHSGSGKANQYFLRGFNLDHGTDFRTTVDGIPVNMPSHGHGQGYTDLNFLIPELVSAEQYRKGPYAARDGDFSAAGAVDIELVRSLPRAIVDGTAGTFGYGRLLAAGSHRIDEGDLLGAVELLHNDGPWVHPDDYKKYNGVLRYCRGDAAHGFSISAMGYSGTWNSTDQIPERAVDSGSIDRFGSIDPSDGGESKRFSLDADIRQAVGTTLLRARVYALHYDLKLFSNFTYFLDDPVNGDQFEQDDRRFVSGFEFTSTWTPKVGHGSIETEAGVQLRRDDIANGLFHNVGRVRLSTTREDDIVQWGGGPFVETRVSWTNWLRMIAGVRGDIYRASVDSNLAVNSGDAHDFLASPKLSLVFGPWSKTEYYLNMAYGFHSNDARGATISVDPSTGAPADKVPPLVRAKGVDLGVRTQAVKHLQSTLSVFNLDLASELVFVGDAGVTEAGRPSRRSGFEWANFYKPRDWWSLDLDVAYAKARFTDPDPVGDRIPGAVEGVVNGGFTIIDLHHFFGSARVRYFGPRPLTEDNSVRSMSSTLLYADFGYQFQKGVRLMLSGFNLMNEKSVTSTISMHPASKANQPQSMTFTSTRRRADRSESRWNGGRDDP